MTAPYVAFKTLARALVERGGGLIACETVVRLGKSRLAEAYDPHSTVFLPVDVVARLEEVAGEPLITRELAARAGCILIPVEAKGRGRLACSIADVGKEVSDTFAAYSKAMADGHADREELRRIRAELAEVIHAATQAIADVDAQLLEGGGA